ncbi:MAG: hypothetical protein AB1807_12065 [Pseudomonadota bacterium]
MTLPASGPISTDQILNELRIATPGRNYPISTTDADVLALAGKSAGQPVKIPDDFWGKSVTPPTSPVPIAEAYGDSGYANSSTAAGTVSCHPVAVRRGGVPPYTNLWEFTSNPGGFSLSDPSATSPTVSKAYTKNSNGTFRALLKYTLTDSIGQKATVSNVIADLAWDGSL